VVAIKHEVGRPGVAETYDFFKKAKDSGILLSDPLEANSPLWVELFGMQWMGTSNYEYWGGKVPEYFGLLHEGPWEKAMEVYRQITPARTQRTVEQASSAGANFIHRYMWKYQAWLNGFNGGPLRQPVMKLTDGQMRRLRDALTRSGLEPEKADFSDFYVGRNPC
jgi:4-hydroxy-tetrahydrodipicolinate synthase